MDLVLILYILILSVPDCVPLLLVLRMKCSYEVLYIFYLECSVRPTALNHIFSVRNSYPVF